jgi:FolB domain-containing protein
MTHYASSFSINRLRLKARLGVGEAERAAPQPVELSVRWYFAQEPDCVSNDNGEFIDYAGLSQRLSKAIETREFRLIEFMARELFTIARDYIDDHGGKDIKLWLKLTKCQPAVPDLQEGASFILCDLQAGATVTPTE